MQPDGVQTTIEDRSDYFSVAGRKARGNSPIFYGLGAIGIGLLGQAFSGYYHFFYVDHLGLAVTLAATINVIFAVWDAVNDPLVGFLSDNTRTRWGRRRPWLLVGLPFTLLTTVLVFAVPESMQQGIRLFWYALIMILLFETGATIVGTNYEALFPELFQGVKERARASAHSQGFGMAGELLGFSLTPLVYNQFGFAGMAVLFASIAGVMLATAILRNRENPNAQVVPPLKLKAAFQDVLHDRPFWQFTAVATFAWFTTGVYTLATPFWTKYTLNASPTAPALIFGTVFITAILVVSIWSRLVRKIGIKRTWIWALGMMILSAVSFGFAINLTMGIVGAAIAGAGLGGVKVCREMILARLVDQSLRRTGHRQEGVYYSVNKFAGRLSKILEALALVLLGVLFGYVSGKDPGPAPETAFRFLISVFPLIFLSIAWLLAWKLPLEE